MQQETRCGYIALIGRPNVGKSTLINRILGHKISITSRKPQTTRHRIHGIKTIDHVQAVFVDTPGIHVNPKRAINKAMIETAVNAILDVEVIIFLIDGRKWTEEDALVLKNIKRSKAKLVLAVNKIDQIKNKNELLPLLQQLQGHLQEQGITQCEIVPISAKTGKGVERLEEIVYRLLPEGPHFYPDDQLTDKSNRFMAAELIREKILRLLGEEVPHEVAVGIEDFKEKKDIIHISAIIWVERLGQKKIVIGEGGAQLKEIGQLARIEMEKLFDKKVFLRIWVKIKTGWTDDERALITLGYVEK